MGSHATIVAYDKPIPNYVRIATNISIWLDTPLLSGGGIYTRGTAGKLGDVTSEYTTSLAGRKWRKYSADTELHRGQSASADTKVSVYKICHESEKRSEGVDWIHLT